MSINALTLTKKSSSNSPIICLPVVMPGNIAETMPIVISLPATAQQIFPISWRVEYRIIDRYVRNIRNINSDAAIDMPSHSGMNRRVKTTPDAGKSINANAINDDMTDTAISIANINPVLK